MTMAGWDSVPHLDEKTKAELFADTPPHLREARSQGIPSLGAGAIYPVNPDDFLAKPFKLPDYWPRAFGLDVGWKKTAAVWAAWDQSTDCIYLYAEHYAGQQVPAVHAAAIKARGAWIPGVIDPASRGRQQNDGTQLLATYRAQGLTLTPANNAVEAGIYEIWQRLVTGRLKVFSTMTNWLAEFRLYRRDENGKVVKENDHCLAGDTFVITDKGHQRIRDMVGTSGQVMTIGGRWVDYRNARMTRRAAEMVEVEFADGSCVRCTPDHRFMTVDGWVEARRLEGRRVYDAVSESIKGHSACRSTSSVTPFRSLKGADIIAAARTFSATAFAFIASCGSAGMAALSRQASTFTMTTRTRRTTHPAISFCSTDPSTLLCISSGTTAAFLPKLSLPQPSGIVPTRAASGIESTTSGPSISFTSNGRSCASNAAPSSAPSMSGPTASAPMRANRRPGGFLAWMTKIAPASSAAPGSASTDTPASRRAVEHATVFCRAVRALANRSDVYCLEVPETNAFALANGAVVHNCMDAARYVIMSGRAVATVKPVDGPSLSSLDTVADTTAGY